jgi:acyl-phosphate glycerol 3-phosphate acyltransferase
MNPLAMTRPTLLDVYAGPGALAEHPATTVLILLVSYLIGAVPFGYLVARARGVDIFRQGSGNIGATNVGRILGRRFGFLVFLLDFAKGAVPTAAAAWLTRLRFGSEMEYQLPALLPVGAGLAAFLGHCYSVYLRFRGGKGVATAAGVVAVLLPGPALGAVVVWLAVLCTTRTMSLATLSGAVVLCLLRLMDVAEPFSPGEGILTWFCLVAAGLVFLRHRANIGRLFRGTENRLQESATLLTLAKVLHLLALSFFGPFILAALVFLGYLFVAPGFPAFFAVQVTCGLVAVITALSWTKSESHRVIHKVRATLLVLALLTTLASWPLATAAGYREFGDWHIAGLGLQLLTQLLVLAALALAAWLPAAAPFFGTSAQPLSSKQAEGTGVDAGGKVPQTEMET